METKKITIEEVEYEKTTPVQFGMCFGCDFYSKPGCAAPQGLSCKGIIYKRTQAMPPPPAQSGNGLATGLAMLLGIILIAAYALTLIYFIYLFIINYLI